MGLLELLGNMFLFSATSLAIHRGPHSASTPQKCRKCWALPRCPPASAPQGQPFVAHLRVAQSPPPWAVPGAVSLSLCGRRTAVTREGPPRASSPRVVLQHPSSANLSHWPAGPPPPSRPDLTGFPARTIAGPPGAAGAAARSGAAARPVTWEAILGHYPFAQRLLLVRAQGRPQSEGGGVAPPETLCQHPRPPTRPPDDRELAELLRPGERCPTPPTELARDKSLSTGDGTTFRARPLKDFPTGQGK